MNPNSFSEFLYRSTFWSGGPYFLLFNSLRTEGMNHVPLDGPTLFLSNHQSFFDPVLIGLAARRTMCFLARDTLFHHWFFGWLIRNLYAFPIDQEGTGLAGLKTTIQLLKQGRAVLIFPEGTRTATGQLHPLEPGIHLIIKRAKPKIVPVGIAGAYDAWPSSRKWPGWSPLFLPPDRPTIAVSVGPALDPEPFVEMPREQCVTALDAVLRNCFEDAERLRRK